VGFEHTRTKVGKKILPVAPRNLNQRITIRRTRKAKAARRKCLFLMISFKAFGLSLGKSCRLRQEGVGGKGGKKFRRGERNDEHQEVCK